MQFYKKALSNLDEYKYMCCILESLKICKRILENPC